MSNVERITEALQHLPPAFQQEVLDFAEFLNQKNGRQNDQHSATPMERADFIQQWALRHSTGAAVILDDSREIIY